MMRLDLCEKEFYEIFAEIQKKQNPQKALEWAWSILECTQQDLRNERDNNKVDGEVYNMGRAEGKADVSASLRHILDPDDINNWNLDGLLKEVIRLSQEHAAAVKCSIIYHS